MNSNHDDFVLRQCGHLKHTTLWFSVFVVAVTATNQLWAIQPPESPTAEVDSLPPVQDLTPAPPRPADELVGADEEGEAMLRGPVHEAFAEQVDADPVPGLVVQKKPPEPVEELPPDVRPEGRAVEWISGYWGWDDDQDDFMWVSGIWRDVPQGFRWLPGYWAEVEGGFQWVSGTWVSAQTEEIEYLDEAPPATLEAGPVGAAPSVQHIWVPGCWNWHQSRYAWRPGFWSPGYSNWMWMPARYRWTPRGYYFANGYWDYPMARRGVLFAPYRFRNSVYARRGFLFTPRVSLLANLLPFHLWVRPRYQHYYFGDYYNQSYAGMGLLPWHQHYRQNRGFDPLFRHYSRFGGGSAFYNQVNSRFNTFVNNPGRRPAHTLFDQDRFAAMRLNDNDRHESMLGTRFQNVVADAGRNADGPRFVKLETEQKQRIQHDAAQIRDLVGQRQQTEVNHGGRNVGRPIGEQSERGRNVQQVDPGERAPGGRPNADTPAAKNATARDVAHNQSDRSNRLKLPRSSDTRNRHSQSPRTTVEMVAQVTRPASANRLVFLQKVLNLVDAWKAIIPQIPQILVARREEQEVAPRLLRLRIQTQGMSQTEFKVGFKSWAAADRGWSKQRCTIERSIFGKVGDRTSTRKFRSTSEAAFKCQWDTRRKFATESFDGKSFDSKSAIRKQSSGSGNAADSAAATGCEIRFWRHTAWRRSFSTSPVSVVANSVGESISWTTVGTECWFP